MKFNIQVLSGFDCIVNKQYLLFFIRINENEVVDVPYKHHSNRIISYEHLIKLAFPQCKYSESPVELRPLDSGNVAYSASYGSHRIIL